MVYFVLPRLKRESGMTVLSTYLTLAHVLRSDKPRLLKNEDPRQNIGEHITLNSGSIELGKTWQFIKQ